MIVLPQVKAEHSCLRRVLIRLMSWLLWFLPATAESLADDVGYEYQNRVTLLVAYTIILSCIVPIVATAQFKVPWGYSVLFALGAYLFVGLLYLLYERRWT